MLGLGLAVTVGKRILGGVIESLMSALRGRAEYSENNTDSKAVVKDIDNYELLDKATILLTPTATSDARVHSVKTYTGDDYLGTTWIGGSGWSTITDGISCDGSVSGGNVNNNVEMTDYYGHKFLLTYTLSNVTDSSTLKYKFGGGALVSIEGTDGTHSVVVTNDATVDNFQFVSFTGWAGDITNISIVDVSSDFDFDRASSATRINSDGLVQDMQSITDPELVLNGDFEELGDDVVTNGTFDTDSDWSKGGGATISGGTGNIIGDGSSFTSLTQANVFTVGKSYKITVDVTINSGLGLKFQDGSTNENFGFATTSGSYTFYGTANNSSFVIGRRTGGTAFDSTIDNVSVQQVNVDSEGNDIWNLNATGDSSALITDKLTLNCDDGDFASAAQSYSFVDGNTYKLSFDLTGDNQSKSFTFRDNSSALGGLTEDISLNFEGTETKTFIFTANTNSDAIYIKRNSAGTYSWSIDNVSLKDITFSTDVDLARINYDSNGDNGHILLEPTSTNLITYSENFESGTWGNSSIGTTPTLDGGYTAPDGTNTAYKISNPNQDSFWFTGVGTIADYSRTIWARTVSGTGTAQLTSHNSNTNNTFNLTETWQRFEVNSTTSATGEQSFYAVDFRGSGTLTELLVWGAQVEQLSYATSYIPTLTGSTVTRATETLTGSGNSTLINSTEGVLYAEIASLTSDVDSEARIVLASSGDTNNSLRLYYNTTQDTIEYKCRVSSSNVCDITYDLGNSTQFHKIACKWKQNDFALWVDGVEVGTDTSGSTFSADTLNVLNFSNATTLSDFFYGKCKALAVFNEALSDDELELLTGVTNYGSFGELASANGYTII